MQETLLSLLSLLIAKILKNQIPLSATNVAGLWFSKNTLATLMPSSKIRPPWDTTNINSKVTANQHHCGGWQLLKTAFEKCRYLLKIHSPLRLSLIASVDWIGCFASQTLSLPSTRQHHRDRRRAANYFCRAFQVYTNAPVSRAVIILPCLLFSSSIFKMDLYTHTGNSNNPLQLVYHWTSLRSL